MVDQEIIRICKVKDSINALLTGIDILEAFPETMYDCIIPILKLMSYSDEDISKRIDLINSNKEDAKRVLREEIIKRNSIEGVYFPTREVVRTLALINMSRPSEDNLNNYLRAVRASGYIYDPENNRSILYSIARALEAEDLENNVKEKKLV